MIEARVSSGSHWYSYVLCPSVRTLENTTEMTEPTDGQQDVIQTKPESGCLTGEIYL